MRTMRLAIDPDIARARTPDPVFYIDAAAYAAIRERVFARTWQWLGDLDDARLPGSLAPRTLLPGLLDEPLLLARDDGGALRCLSNVCTHRANLLVTAPCRAREIRCGYHSRRFDLSGRMTFMPEFAGVHGFPSPADDLPAVALAEWDGHAFAALDAPVTFAAYVDDLRARLSSVRMQGLRHQPARDREFLVAANWALYVENYLEGFHIPFVHPDLARTLDYGSYDTELFAYASLQVARAQDGQAAFADGKAAYYAWIFPNLMLNFYPWGLSLNLVEPLGPASTRVRFRSYVGDASALDVGAGGGLHAVEAEDEAIVEAVQRGVASRLYRGGRYSPTRERGVHHFHRLLAAFLEESPTRGAPGV
jgi:choline monooxygenase